MVCVWCSLKATSSLTFCSEIDSEGKEKQASEREIDRHVSFQRRGRLSSPLACLLLQGDSRVSKLD